MAVTKKMVEGVRLQLESLAEKLRDYQEQKQEVLDNANDAEYPNEEKIAQLEEQIEILERAADDLENLAGDLEAYE